MDDPTQNRKSRDAKESGWKQPAPPTFQATLEFVRAEIQAQHPAKNPTHPGADTEGEEVADSIQAMKGREEPASASEQGAKINPKRDHSLISVFARTRQNWITKARQTQQQNIRSVTGPRSPLR